jgi:acetolactate synthase I/II/III large subunit
MRVADYIAQTVERTGAECFFMLSGGMMMHLMDAFGRLPGMRYFCNHHEQACAMGADGYARQSGKLGVCMATSGPGATNLLTGLVGAYQDSVPVLFITGQCKREDTARASGIEGLRQNGFLEVDIVPIVESVTKYAAFVESPERARYHLEKALHLALEGRPGPVLLDIPLDVQGAAFPEDSEPFHAPVSTAEPAADADLLSLLDRIAQARRPLILAGHGVRCASQAAAFHQFVDRLQIPVVTSLMAKDLMAFDHPLWVGHPGPRAHRAANFAVQTADLIVTMGCSLHVQTVGYEGDMFAPHAHKIQIDLERPLLQREKVGVHQKYAWDIHDYLPRLAAAAGRHAECVPAAWREVCERWKREYNIMKDAHLLGEPDDRVNLYEFVDLLSDALAGDETILTDAGQPHPILGQAFRVKGTQRYLNPGSFAEMGWALPTSFGVAAADPSKNVIAIIGDGSLQTNIQELQTLAHHQFNVKLFVINNDGYGSIRRTQETFFKGFYVGSTPGSGVTLPETEKVAGAYGVPYMRVENRGVARQRVAQVLSQRGPVLCEVMGQIDQRILPVVASRLLPDGRMRSNSLEEMNPPVSLTFDDIRTQAGV